MTQISRFSSQISRYFAHRRRLSAKLHSSYRQGKNLSDGIKRRDSSWWGNNETIADDWSTINCNAKIECEQFDNVNELRKEKWDDASGRR